MRTPVAGRRPCRGRALAAGLAAVAVLVTGCAGGGGPGSSNGAPNFHGTVLPSPLPLPDLTLVGPGGKPYPVRDAGSSTVTLMYFGYTRCPDICSVDMATVAGGLRRLPAEVQSKVRVLFVTTDPQRDDPAVLARWLGRFDSSLSTKFIGLTGTQAQIEQAQKDVNLPVAEKAGTLPGSKDYAVTHAGVVAAFGPDGTSHVVYLQGTSLSDYVADLPLLADGVTPAQAASGTPTAGIATGNGQVGDVTVIGARARPAADGFAVSMTLSLATDQPDSLVAVSSSAGATSLVDSTGKIVTAPVVIPTDQPTVLAAGSTGIRISQDAAQQAPTRDVVTLTLTFARSGTLLLDVPVVR